MHGIVMKYAYIPAGTKYIYGKPVGNTRARGSNGYIIKTPVQAIIEVKDDNGRLHTVDIISILRKKARMEGKNNITKARVKEAGEVLIKIKDVELSDDGKEILNLFDII